MFRNKKKFHFDFQFDVVGQNNNGKWLLKLSILTSLLICIGHLFLGSNTIVVLLAMLIIILGTVPIAIAGYFQISALFIFFVAFRYVDFATVAKLSMLQPLDSNLYQPVEAFLAVLLGLSGYLIAFLISVTIPVGKPLLKKVLCERQLLIISIVSAFIGGIAWLGKINAVNEIANGVDISQSPSVYAFFTSFSLLAIISATAHKLIASDGKSSISRWCAILILLQFIFGFIANSRMIILNGILSYFFTVIAFRGRIQWKNIVTVVIVSFLIISFITPSLLYVRAFRTGLPAIDRIRSTIETVITSMNNVRTFSELNQRIDQSKSLLNYYGEPKNVLERASLVEHVDLIVNAIEDSHYTGIKSIKIGIGRILPRFLNPKKTVGWSIGDWIYDKIQVQSFFGGYATVPLIAEGYSCFGWLGVFFFPILFAAPLFIVFKKIGSAPLRNIWAVFLVMAFHNSFVEGNSSEYMITLFRFLPQDLFLILTMNFVAKILVNWPFNKEVIIITSKNL